MLKIFDKEIISISKEIRLIIGDNHLGGISEGIIDGEKIINSYLQGNERGLAFEH